MTEPSPALVSDLAASFQEAVVDAIVAKTRQALERTGMKRLGVGGGVAANTRMRQKLAEMAAAKGVELFIPPAALCTDNAAMAGIALPKARRRARWPPSISTSPPAWSARTTARDELRHFPASAGATRTGSRRFTRDFFLAIRSLLGIELVPPLKRLLVDRRDSTPDEGGESTEGHARVRLVHVPFLPSGKIKLPKDERSLFPPPISCP